MVSSQVPHCPHEERGGGAVLRSRSCRVWLSVVMPTGSCNRGDHNCYSAAHTSTAKHSAIVRIMSLLCWTSNVLDLCYVLCYIVFVCVCVCVCLGSESAGVSCFPAVRHSDETSGDEQVRAHALISLIKSLFV